MKKILISFIMLGLLLSSNLFAGVGYKFGMFSNNKVLDYSTNSVGYSFGIDVDKYVTEEISFNYGISLEGQNMLIGLGSYTSLIFEVNGKYNVNNSVYAFGGLNYPLALSEITQISITGDNLDPDVRSETKNPKGSLGFQLGAGLRILNFVSLELSYKFINSNLGTISSGFLVSSRFSF